MIWSFIPVGLVFSYPWEPRFRNKGPCSEPYDTPEVEMGFDTVISSRALTHSFKPNCLPYCFSEKYKKVCFLLESQDLLERAPPQNSVPEVVFGIGVMALSPWGMVPEMGKY